MGLRNHQKYKLILLSTSLQPAQTLILATLAQHIVVGKA